MTISREGDSGFATGQRTNWESEEMATSGGYVILPGIRPLDPDLCVSLAYLINECSEQIDQTNRPWGYREAADTTPRARARALAENSSDARFTANESLGMYFSGFNLKLDPLPGGVSEAEAEVLTSCLNHHTNRMLFPCRHDVDKKDTTWVGTAHPPARAWQTSRLGHPKDIGG